VSVEQVSTGKYWDGRSFSAPALALLAASGTTAWRYPIGLPPDGDYRVYVGATDRNGITTSPSSLLTLSFNIDTAPPPPPSITSAPEQSTTATDASFAFDGGAGAAFSCSLDGGAGSPCTTSSGQGQATYGAIRPGGHCFRVTATDPAGNTSSPATYCWTVTEPQAPPPQGGGLG
jgi:hypothetical protein